MHPILILTPNPDRPDKEGEVAMQLARFARLGLKAELRPWTSPGDLSPFRLIVPLMAWGYHQHGPRWAASLDAWEGLPFANPVHVLRWNGNKAYLLELADKGASIVPTCWAEALTPDDLAAARAAFGTQRLVVKPPVSAGADGTYLLDGDAPEEALGQTMLIQPMIPAIAEEGEFSLFYFNGRLSHAILKTPQSGDFRVQSQFGGRDRPVDAPPEARAVAEAAMAAVPGTLTYARVDLVRTATGFAIMELELIEPYLFLHHAADGGAAFVEALNVAAG